MNKILMYKLVKKLKQRPDLMRKFKIFILIGFVGFIITFGLLVWTGISVVKYAATNMTEIIQSEETSLIVENVQQEITALPTLQLANCWSKTQSMLNAATWLGKPLKENFDSLRAACLPSSSEENQYI